MAAAHARGLPPYVVPWSPGTSAFATSSVARNAPIGTPQPSAFATVRISGLTPYCSYANIVPVLPIPHWISSSIRRIPFSSQSFLTP